MKTLQFLTTIGLFCLARALQADDAPGTAELTADVESIQPGRPFQAGILIRLPEKWHTYWRNAGDAGMPPGLTWKLPAGFTHGPVLWPAPQRFDEPPLTSFGYAGEVLLLSEIQPPADLPVGTNYTLEVKMSWLVCREVCMPKSSRLLLTLPARAEPPAPAAHWAALFAQARQSLPVWDASWAFQARAEAGALTLCVTPPSEAPAVDWIRVLFFPAQPGLVEYGAQPWVVSESGACLSLPRLAGGAPLPDLLQGVLVLPREEGSLAMEMSVSIENEEEKKP